MSICGLCGAHAALAAPPPAISAAADATIAAVAGIAELNEIVEVEEFAQSDGSERPEDSRGKSLSSTAGEIIEGGEHSGIGEKSRTELESALDNDAASSAAEAANARQDVTEAVQEQQQSENGPQG